MPELPRSLRRTPALDAWVRIDPQETVTIFTGKVEIGQGIKRAIARIAAEELDVAWDQVSFVFAPAHPAYGMMGMQVTGGSTSVIQSWEPLREAGAKARWMLREAAAQQWGVPAEQVQIKVELRRGRFANAVGRVSSRHRQRERGAGRARACP